MIQKPTKYALSGKMFDFEFTLQFAKYVHVTHKINFFARNRVQISLIQRFLIVKELFPDFGIGNGLLIYHHGV